MSRWSIGAAVCAVLVLPSVARAQSVVYACVGNVSKVVRIVGETDTCRTAPPALAETAVQWNIQGPPGCARDQRHERTNGTHGTTGTNGTDGLNGTNGTNGTSGTRADGPCFDNTNRYVDCGNGTVTDTVTGLIWLQQADCLPDNTGPRQIRQRPA